MINKSWHFSTNIYHSKCLLFKKSNMRYVDGVAKPILWVDIDDVIFHLWPDLIKYYNLEYGEHKTLKRCMGHRIRSNLSHYREI